MQIFVAIPLSLIASVVYCQVAFWILEKWPRVRLPIAGLSWFLLLLTLACVSATIWPGARFLTHTIGRFYELFYGVCFLGGPPALANVLIIDSLKKGKKRTEVLRVSVFSCWANCVAFAIGDWIVYHIVYGPA